MTISLPPALMGLSPPATRTGTCRQHRSPSHATAAGNQQSTPEIPLMGKTGATVKPWLQQWGCDPMASLLLLKPNFFHNLSRYGKYILILHLFKKYRVCTKKDYFIFKRTNNFCQFPRIKIPKIEIIFRKPPLFMAHALPEQLSGQTADRP